MALIELEGVGKSFTTQRGRGMLVGRGGIGDWIRGKRAGRFDALKDISFTVDHGESVGIIGANGSGKSTLLKILAGVTAPTRGSVTVNGKVASLLELGAGFHPLLTGRENIYLNGRILGMNHADVDRVFDLIVEFSGIEEFIDQAVETYSSGMYVRLGFSVAVHANPDVFLVDEVLSVGDEEFQRRCRERIGQLREEGKTIVFVSHDLSIVNTLCERVILLTNGTMIVRDSAQATIDYYLRLVGRKKGIHKVDSGPDEAIFSNGRLAVFHDRREASAPNGFQVHLTSMGDIHYSTSADWKIVERNEGSCTARGRMAKLPIVQVWKLHFENGRLVWEIAFEVERAVKVNVIDVNLFMPVGYTHWYYGDQHDRFPEIPVSQNIFVNMHRADPQIQDAAVTGDEGGTLPGMLFHLDSPRHGIQMKWVNTDYVVGCRALQAGGDLPPDEAELQPGVHPILTLTMKLGATTQELDGLAEDYRRARTVSSGDTTARFDRGMVRLYWKGRELTHAVHIYNSLFINDFWNDSQTLHWEGAAREGDRLILTGRSRRFPYLQEWDLVPREDGVELTIWLEASDPVEVQEYQVSVGLPTEYDRWETTHERGEYPPIDRSDMEWRHANHDYTPSTWARALSQSLPSVMLEVTVDDAPFRMTAINTDYVQSSRVLQALRTAEGGRIRFEPGRHLLFSGRVRVREG